jgi:hypothetical protein
MEKPSLCFARDCVNCRTCKKGITGNYSIPEDLGMPARNGAYPARFTILWTPHNAIPRGNRFFHAHFELSLSDGIWPLGMILRHSTANTMHVVCGIGRAYTEPLPEKLPSQWLARIEDIDRASVNGR